MISVVVPTKGSDDLGDCLKSLKNQTKKPGEIITVFDAKIRDVQVAKKYQALVVFDKNGTIGGAYAAGAKAARGDIIAFIDDDAIAPKYWLAQIAKTFKKEDIDAAGGDDVPPGNSTSFQKAVYQIDLARKLDKPVYGEKAESRLRAVNIAFKKEIFDKFMFNKKLRGLQEPEFLHRLHREGYKMKFDPKMYVYHKRRSTLKGIFHQIYRNGKAKIELIKLHKDLLSFVDMVPFIAIIYILLLLNLPIRTAIFYFFTPFLLYFVAKPAAILFRTRKFRYYPLLFLIVLTREIAYGLGILAGIKNLFKRL